MVEEHYWRVGGREPELTRLCELAIEEARSGRQLARAASLIVGAQLVDELGQQLREKIAARVKAICSTNSSKEALKDAKGIGEALALLNQAQTWRGTSRTQPTPPRDDSTRASRF